MDLLSMMRNAVITGPDGVVVGDITVLHFYGDQLVIETDIELVDISDGDPDGGEEVTPEFDTESLTDDQRVGEGGGPQLVFAAGGGSKV